MSSFSSPGSVIASLNVSYSAVDSLQIVLLQEELAGGRLGDTPAQLLGITSTNHGKSYQPEQNHSLSCLIIGRLNVFPL